MSPPPPEPSPVAGGDVSWREIWERKGSAPVDAYSLEALMALDGYDVGAGALGPRQFEAIVSVVEAELALEPGMRLLEVGCGAGALLFCLREAGLQLFGVDFSASLIEHARRAVPQATFAVSEATEIEFEADAIVCCGVFHYFPDYDYAQRVLAAFRAAAPVALVMDVPDAATREASEAARRRAGSKPGRHLYYPRSFFGVARTWGSEIPGYANAPFRFHAMLSAP